MAISSNSVSNISLNSFPNQQMFPNHIQNYQSYNFNFPQTMKPLIINSTFANQAPIPMQQLPLQSQHSNSSYDTKKSKFNLQLDSLVYQNNKHKLHPKSKFTPVEDQKLRELVAKYGDNDWATVSKMMGTRNQRQCRERWTNYLSPKVSNGPWSPQEDELLRKLHAEIGAKWVKISSYFPSRTDTNIKNRWMVLLRQRKALENASKCKMEKENNFIEKQQELQISAYPEDIPNEKDAIISLEAESQIDFMEGLSSLDSLMSSDYLFDMSWM